MKYFDRDGKFNFVDEHNVVLGYDSQQDCCEHAGWFVTPTEQHVGTTETTDMLDRAAIQWDSYRFDPDYFKQLLNVAANGRDYPDLDDGGAVQFRLVSDTKPSLYLVIYNSHNGYYGHGFSFSVPGKPERQGCL